MDRSGRKITFGIILVLIGLLLMARTMGLLNSSEMGRMMGAFALITIGVYLIVRRRHREYVAQEEDSQSGSSSRSYTWSSSGSASAFTSGSDSAAGTAQSSGSSTQSGPSERPETRSDGDLRYSKLFGDMFIDTSGVGFENIEISSGVGDLQLRLKGSRLVGSLNRVIISGFIGDLRIFVPRGMAYSATCSNFIGDLDVAGKTASGFGNNISTFSPDYDTAAQKLYIAANSFIGDIRVVVVD